MIKAIPDSRRQGSLFESPDLMARIGWFVPFDNVPPCLGLGVEVTEDHVSEAGGSSAPPPDAGGTSRSHALALSRFSSYYAYRVCSNLLSSLSLSDIMPRRHRPRRHVPAAAPIAEATIAACPRVEARRRGSPPQAGNEAISSNKRSSPSIPFGPPSGHKRAHTSAVPNGMDSMLLAEAAELRDRCSQGILETSLRDFKSLLTVSDLEYFQSGIGDARKV